MLYDSTNLETLEAGIKKELRILFTQTICSINEKMVRATFSIFLSTYTGNENQNRYVIKHILYKDVFIIL